MTELDTILAALRDGPLPDALDGLDQPVMAGLAALRERQTTVRSLSLACVVAGMVGLWAGVGTDAANPHRAETLLGVPAAAPSSLLVD